VTTIALGPTWLDPDHLIATFGLIGVLIVIFAESGLLIGFFLPGDSLLFTTGLLVVNGKLGTPLWLVCVLVALAAIAGDQVGYLFGRKVGPSLFKRPDSRLFKQENVEKAHEFFEKYGPKSLVLARFVPIVRTFTPIIAGVSRMNYRAFVTYNVIGGTLWAVGVTLLGAALGKVDFVNQHIELILVAIVLVSVVPIAIEYLRARSKANTTRSEPDDAPQDVSAGPAAYGPASDPGTGFPGAHYPAAGSQGYLEGSGAQGYPEGSGAQGYPAADGGQGPRSGPGSAGGYYPPSSGEITDGAGEGPGDPGAPDAPRGRHAKR
jgi:membrane-associated protein